MARELRFGTTVATNALLQKNPKEFYTEALLENRSSAQFRQVLNVKEKEKIASLAFGTLLFPADCEYQGGSQTLDAKEMEVCKIQIGTDLCMYELETSFLADWMKSGSNGDWLPADFATFMFAELGRNVSEQLEVLTWQGDTDVVFDEDDPSTFIGLCDGLLKKLCDATIPSGQAIVGANVTSSNVIAQLTLVYNAIPARLRSKRQQVKWFVSQNIADAYLLAVAVQSAEQYTNKVADLSFLGYTLTVGEGMPDNVMTVSLADNYVFLADMVSDPSDLNVIDLNKSIGEKKIRVRSDFKIGFDYLNDAEWVVYGVDCLAS